MDVKRSQLGLGYGHSGSCVLPPVASGICSVTDDAICPFTPRSPGLSVTEDIMSCIAYKKTESPVSDTLHGRP
jgi:hypothetical protein